MSESDVILVITNLPDRPTAERIADVLVTEGVAACINILAGCTSIYRWEGKLEHTDEVPLLIKTTRGAYPRLEAMLKELHPYELPELIALPVSTGLPAYLSWVTQETNGHDNCAALKNETRDARFPHLNPDGTTSHSTKPASGQVAGYLPQAGEEANESLREFNVNARN